MIKWRVDMRQVGFSMNMASGRLMDSMLFSSKADALKYVNDFLSNSPPGDGFPTQPIEVFQCDDCKRVIEEIAVGEGDKHYCVGCHRFLRDQRAAHEAGEDCGVERCQECCPHDERDHGICLDCEHEEDPGAAIDRAMDLFEDR